MNAEKTETISTVDHKPHAAFFRQSGWMMLSTVFAGFMTFGVHPLNKYIPDAEYTVFVLLSMVMTCVPTTPLQMVFTQQAAQTIVAGRPRQLSGLIRLAWFWTSALWLVGALIIYHFQNQLIAIWQLPNAMCLWLAVIGILLSVWIPLFGGVLQGRQDFFWLGWSTILAGVTRLAFAVLLVLALKKGATGMVLGVIIGMGVGVVIAIWRTRDLWRLRPEKFDYKILLQQTLPLLFGFGAWQFMFTSDTMFTKVHFSDAAMKPYALAGTLARALLWVVLPLAAVMFPKIVQSHAKSEKNDLFGLVVLGTAILSICGAAGLWVLGPWLIRLVARSGDVAGTVALFPWYAGAMMPLAMANVLVNDLLARGRFAVVPFMVLLAVAYGITLPLMLNHFPGRLVIALQTLAVFNTLLFLICAGFAWGKRREKRG